MSFAIELPRGRESNKVYSMARNIGYKNNNDDQTAFSLLFKLYGFRAFSVEERDAVVYTGRNLAKFIKAGPYNI